MLASIRDREQQLHQNLGLKRLNPWWAKAEILGGLAAVGIGLAMLQTVNDLSLQVGGLALFVFGGYLALAGHRSHLYQSNNALAAWIVQTLTESDDSRAKDHS